MTAAAVAKNSIGPATAAAVAGDLAALARRAQVSGATESAGALLDEARMGVARLSRMSHAELRAVIADRVRLLETELREREARRTAIEEAMIAQRVLESRRIRARAIRRKVNIGSSLMAAMFTGFIVVAMF